MANFDLNKVILAGRLTADPELKQTVNGISVTSFHIAVNRRKEKDGKQTADFITCVAWRQTAEFICQYFRRGSSICVLGSIQTREYMDKEKRKRIATEVLIDEARFVDSKSQNADSGGAQVTGERETYTDDIDTQDIVPALEDIGDADLPF